MKISFTAVTEGALKVHPPDSELGFGKFFTDHMFCMNYSSRQGWTDARIVPYGDLSLDPAAMALHYGQEIFEGLKAYRLQNGGIALFRPEDNFKRMESSARRMCMPGLEPTMALEALREFVLKEHHWIPSSKGTSLYLRPTMIATDAAVGMRPSETYLFYIIASPVGAYYSAGFKPTRIFVSDNYVRAVAGGAGEAKTACNYGPTLLVFQEAKSAGYDQVLWLDGKENKYVEEVGTSNIFFWIDNELITPPLAGTILPGITRDCVLLLARNWGLNVSERKISIEEVVDGCRNGAVQEVFATGTAAIISPIGTLGYKGEDIQVGDVSIGHLSQKLFDEITGIQYGRRDDPFSWVRRIG